MKEFTVKEDTTFRLRVKIRKCAAPEGLNSLDFLQESLDNGGQVSISSTYNFFLTDQQLKTLAEELVK